MPYLSSVLFSLCFPCRWLCSRRTTALQPWTGHTRLLWIRAGLVFSVFFSGLRLKSNMVKAEADFPGLHLCIVLRWRGKWTTAFLHPETGQTSFFRFCGVPLLCSSASNILEIRYLIKKGCWACSADHGNISDYIYIRIYFVKGQIRLWTVPYFFALKLSGHPVRSMNCHLE